MAERPRVHFAKPVAEYRDAADLTPWRRPRRTKGARSAGTTMTSPAIDRVSMACIAGILKASRCSEDAPSASPGVPAPVDDNMSDAGSDISIDDPTNVIELDGEGSVELQPSDGHVALGDIDDDPVVDSDVELMEPTDDHLLTHKPADPEHCETCMRAKSRNVRKFSRGHKREVTKFGELLTFDHMGITNAWKDRHSWSSRHIGRLRPRDKV